MPDLGTDNAVRLVHPWKTNIYSYLETSGGKNPYIYLNVVHFFNTSVD